MRRRGEERRGAERREGTQRWTGRAAFNLARAASSQLSEGDGVRALRRRSRGRSTLLIPVGKLILCI